MNDIQKEKNNGKIMFQCVMNYKAYRRIMIMTRLSITLVIAGALCAFCVISIVLGIVLAVAVLCLGAIAIIVGLPAEQSYTVYDDHIVIKRRGTDKRTFVDTDKITAVSYRRAFYEKGLATGTITITANAEKGSKKYKLKHVFNAAPIVKYLQDTILERKNDEDRK